MYLSHYLPHSVAEEEEGGEQIQGPGDPVPLAGGNLEENERSGPSPIELQKVSFLLDIYPIGRYTRATSGRPLALSHR